MLSKILPLVMALLQGIKKLFNSRLPDSPIRGVDDSPTHRVEESIFDYENLHEFEAKIETARKLVWGTYADLNYANYAGRCFSFFSSSGTTCTSFKIQLPTPRRGVDVRLRMSPRIRSQNQKCSKASVRDLCRPELCENIGKFGSLPCPFNKVFLG